MTQIGSFPAGLTPGRGRKPTRVTDTTCTGTRRTSAQAKLDSIAEIEDKARKP
jgi:hypothetical protein